MKPLALQVNDYPNRHHLRLNPKLRNLPPQGARAKPLEEALALGPVLK